MKIKVSQLPAWLALDRGKLFPRSWKRAVFETRAQVFLIRTEPGRWITYLFFPLKIKRNFQFMKKAGRLSANLLTAQYHACYGKKQTNHICLALQDINETHFRYECFRCTPEFRNPYVLQFFIFQAMSENTNNRDSSLPDHVPSILLKIQHNRQHGAQIR